MAEQSVSARVIVADDLKGFANAAASSRQTKAAFEDLGKGGIKVDLTGLTRPEVKK